ncbi:hypothetical protein DFH08DRAFT_286511 [Mycena albidolilacea]|uniref:GAG-pre-integrase domain-containing protein n=1 Tax=Mycena albidolilacea TaxID=1033008 RepID=A0AAD7EMR4_9AGAR|nr:hypothetical protein DFH08DRAFT_286511 [Mycena albidolilacea]
MLDEDVLLATRCVRDPEFDIIAWYAAHRRRALMEAVLLNGMYVLEFDEVVGTAAWVARSRDVPVTKGTWHRRLGHLGGSGLDALVSGKHVNGLHVREGGMDGLCEDCISGKHAYEEHVAAGLRGGGVLAPKVSCRRQDAVGNVLREQARHFSPSQPSFHKSPPRWFQQNRRLSPLESRDSNVLQLARRHLRGGSGASFASSSRGRCGCSWRRPAGCWGRTARSNSLC